MRWLVLSLAAHGVLVAALPAQRSQRSPRAGVPTTDRGVDAYDAPVVDVLDVALVTLEPNAVASDDEPGEARARALDSAPHHRARAQRPRVASSLPVTDDGVEAPSGDLPAGVLAMRAGGVEVLGQRAPVARLDLSIDGVAAAIAAAPGGGVGREQDRMAAFDDGAGGAPGGDLDDFMTASGGGTYAYRRSTFRIDVARDGSVTIEDEPNLKIDVGLPCVSCLVDDFERWREDPYGGHTVSLLGLLPVLRAGFDFTDWLERLVGNDPYQYEKARMLDATRERRAQMSATERRERTRDALAKLPELLEAVWTFEGWSERERRAVLFTLWDECDDSAAGAQARATILGFVRRRVTGYTSAELEALNAGRSSRHEFAP